MLASARPRSIHYSSWVEEMYHLETDTPEDIQARITRMAAEQVSSSCLRLWILALSGPFQEAAAKLSKTNEASVLEVAKKKASNRWKAIAFHVKAFAVLVKMAKMFQPKPSRRQ